jgi:hypothetical protein
MICRWVDIYRRFEESMCLYLQEHGCEKFKCPKANQNWRVIGSCQDLTRSHMLRNGVGFLKK